MLFYVFVLHGEDVFDRYSNFVLYCSSTFTCNGSWNDGVWEWWAANCGPCQLEWFLLDMARMLYLVWDTILIFRDVRRQTVLNYIWPSYFIARMCCVAMASDDGESHFVGYKLQASQFAMRWNDEMRLLLYVWGTLIFSFLSCGGSCSTFCCNLL